MLTREKKSIWYDWRKMHFRSESINEGISIATTAIRNELEELNSQMAELEDDNEDWLPALIANEF